MSLNLQERYPRLSTTISVVEPAQEAAWDKYVASHPNGWICLTSTWKHILEECFPHIKGYLLALTDEDGVIQAGLALYAVESWLTGRRLVSVPFATLSDPLSSSESQSKALFESAISLSQELKTDYVEIRTFKSAMGSPEDQFQVVNSYRHHYIPLERDLDQIKKSFDRTCVRQRISRAEKSGVTVHPVSTEMDLKTFYKLYLITRKRLNLPPQPYRFIRSLWDHFGPDTVSARLACYKGEYVAGILLFRYRDRVSAEFMVMDERFHAVSPNHLLFWEAIREAWERKYRVFDFGRTAVTNIPLMDFKKRWGTVMGNLPIQYYSIRGNSDNPENHHSMLRAVIKQICKKAPNPLLEVFGNFIYKHMS